MSREISSCTALEQDAVWMLMFQAGDVQGFELLLAAYREPVFRYLVRMVRNRAVAEELTQDVFLRVYRSCNYQPTARFRSWLYRIATNVGINAMRDRRPESRALYFDHRPAHLGRGFLRSDARNAEEHLVFTCRLQEVRSAIDALPERHRAAVLMHKYLEMEYWEIAVALHCSVPAVKSLIFRAYETLRTRLAHFDPNGWDGRAWSFKSDLRVRKCR